MDHSRVKDRQSMMPKHIVSMALQIGSSFHHPLNIDKKLLVLTHLGNHIIEEFNQKRDELEYKNFNHYQEETIKKTGQGQSIDMEQYTTAPDCDGSGWCLAPLIYNGNDYSRNSNHMPKTTKILNHIGHTSYTGIAVLYPEYGLDWHYDDDQFIGHDQQQFRVFYTLDDGGGGAYIEVEETEKKIVKRYFRQREYVCFHSKNRHRVWNEGILPRYSLVIDVLK